MEPDVFEADLATAHLQLLLPGCPQAFRGAARSNALAPGVRPVPFHLFPVRCNRPDGCRRRGRIPCARRSLRPQRNGSQHGQNEPDTSQKNVHRENLLALSASHGTMMVECFRDVKLPTEWVLVANVSLTRCPIKVTNTRIPTVYVS